MINEELLNYSIKIPLPYSEVLQLYYKEKLTKKQISERMNISYSKVKGYLSKGNYLVRKASGDPELKKAEKILKGGNSNESFRLLSEKDSGSRPE